MIADRSASVTTDTVTDHIGEAHVRHTRDAGLKRALPEPARGHAGSRRVTSVTRWTIAP